jgi:hypothetical protein
MISTDLCDHPYRFRNSCGYLLDTLPDMTRSQPSRGTSGHAGAVQS